MSHDPYPHRPPPPYSPHPSPYATHPWQPPTGHRADHRGHHSDVRTLRTAYRRQRRTATFTALGYFLAFLCLSAFAPSSLTHDVTDGLPLGLLLALLQLPVTWLAIAVYEHTARRGVDPLADRIRKESEAAARREATR
ncbi:DUF485 domain-containing protein [Streptomyces sp. NPDC053750]|uniref:DUF485 domain-containing protein n=1 Tax=Streptomyces sp. NPDC053750 TaxID=3365714 RepID=UPI0037CE46D3